MTQDIIDVNKVVSISYTLIVEDEVMETVKEDKPMQFIFGTGYLLPKFEQQIEGKKVGDAFAFTLSAKDGYGEVDPDYIIELPKSAFMVDGKLQDGLLAVDKVIPMRDSAGNVLQGVVKEIGEENVKMDFNHPLAGAELNFSGKVVAVREATEKELEEGLFGEKVHHQCSESGCDHCSGCH